MITRHLPLARANRPTISSKVTARDRKTGQQKDIIVEAARARLSEAEIIEAQERVTEAVGLTAIAPTAELTVLTERARLESLLADVRQAQAAGDASHADVLLEELLDLLFDLEN